MQVDTNKIPNIATQFTRIIEKDGTSQNYINERNSFIRNCLDSKYIKYLIALIPIALTATWYFSLNIYRHFCSPVKIQESIVLQHQESYFIGIILVGFFALISIGLALNLYARYILKERKSSTSESLGALNWIWLLINVLYCFISIFTGIQLLIWNIQTNFAQSIIFLPAIIFTATSFYHVYTLLPHKSVAPIIFYILCTMILAISICCSILKIDLFFYFSEILSDAYLLFGSMNIFWFCMIGAFFIGDQLRSSKRQINIKKFFSNSSFKTSRPFRYWISQDLLVISIVFLSEFYLVTFLMLLIFNAIDTNGRDLASFLYSWMTVWR